MNYFDVYIRIYNDIFLCMKPIPSNISSSPLLSPSSWPDSPDSKSITWALALGNHGMPEKNAVWVRKINEHHV